MKVAFARFNSCLRYGGDLDRFIVSLTPLKNLLRSTPTHKLHKPLILLNLFSKSVKQTHTRHNSTATYSGQRLSPTLLRIKPMVVFSVHVPVNESCVAFE